ncbi:ATP-binding protein [Nocardia goodfellowii]|uniref:biotin carboxylase n=1 Tax=Nocardia goodfellowii TaxID=882446 RepID=A0ABS4QBU6_9NOCA|nr:biotin carboxylase N-terminal domain-containing protein [Nocardia goodfellowii]MBP2189168.1 propionyl-CoA carboxylase alpha chain/3-methylcrotonyl-CoA carboxylase alpha subunit [Nocardia goodfellowii]
MISTLLIANRGEVAARIARTCDRLGIDYVTVSADEDRDLTYHDGAVATVRLPAASGHLDAAALVRAATETGCDAVHPGYGFLSEHAGFARAVRSAGLVFVGPSSRVIETMADKASALLVMAEAGVPVLPGTRAATDDLDALARAADDIGYPLIVKPAGGGGGKGMSVVRSPDDLRESLASATRTATAAFADGRLHLERYVEQARHIEVQVFGDEFGSAVHLFDRDCSLQRRHQKVIEEAPAPRIPEPIRQRIFEAAVRGAQALNYVGAGTFEFLLVGDEFFFIEMNTRLQVEHTVTEEITGVDLVEWQLRVAAGEPLPVTQEQITYQGASVQVRMYAEDPFRSFLPCPGELEVTHWPDVRIERAFEHRLTVTGGFDPMIAKLVATGATRAEALATARAACAELRWTGISTNLGFAGAVLASPILAAAEHDTAYLDRIDPVTEFADPDLLSALAIAAALTAPDRATPWSAGAPVGDRAWLDPTDHDLGSVDLVVDGRPFTIRVSGYDGDAVRVRADTAGPGVRCVRSTGDTISVGATPCVVRRLGEGWVCQVAGVSREVRYAEYRSFGSTASDPEIRSPMPGTVVRLHVESGALVEQGQLLGVVEAMKMEHELTATHPGIVTVTATEGAVVTTDQPLFLIEERSAAL